MNLHDRDQFRQRKDISVPLIATEDVSARSVKISPPYMVEYADGSLDFHGKGKPLFKIQVATRSHLSRLFKLNSYSLAMRFVQGDFSVEGDLVAAVRFYQTQPKSRIQAGFLAALAKFGIGRVESWFQTKKRAARNIRFHYDQSNEFYRQFLDPWMVYSCAYFKDPGQSLEEAQFRKLGHICRKLDLHAGEMFLDVGCGWGGLIAHAAEEYGTLSTGCTLSTEQFNYARSMVA